MPLYILDTDIVTHLHRGHGVLSRRVALVPANDLATTAITVEEVLSGWYTAARQVRQPHQLEQVYGRLIASVEFLAQFSMLNLTQPAIARHATLAKQKLKAGKNDLRIAAIALEAGAIVVTANTRDFARVLGLSIEDWTVPPGP